MLGSILFVFACIGTGFLCAEYDRAGRWDLIVAIVVVLALLFVLRAFAIKREIDRLRGMRVAYRVQVIHHE